MSATGFHPEPSAKAPWTRTMVLTAAYAGDDAAKAALITRARIKRYMLQLHKIAPPHCPGGGDRADRDRGELQQGIAAGEMGFKVRFASPRADVHARSRVEIRGCSADNGAATLRRGAAPTKATVI